MLAEERRASLLKEVTSRGYIEVSEMSARFDVSEPTIRRDLDQLQEEGKLIRTRGGAIAATRSTTLVVPYETKRHANTEQKQRIAVEAVKFVREGDRIILDAGSTNFELALKLMQSRMLTVVTNDLRIGVQLAGNPNIELISTGGIARAAVYSLVGPETIDFLHSIHVETTFVAVDAVHPDGGVYNNIPEEAGVKKAMIQAAEKVILVVDSSKFDSRGFAHICDLDRIDVLITDSDVPEATLERFQQSDVEVKLV